MCTNLAIKYHCEPLFPNDQYLSKSACLLSSDIKKWHLLLQFWEHPPLISLAATFLPVRLVWAKPRPHNLLASAAFHLDAFNLLILEGSSVLGLWVLVLFFLGQTIGSFGTFLTFTVSSCACDNNCNRTQFSSIFWDCSLSKGSSVELMVSWRRTRMRSLFSPSISSKS